MKVYIKRQTTFPGSDSSSWYDVIWFCQIFKTLPDFAGFWISRNHIKNLIDNIRWDLTRFGGLERFIEGIPGREILRNYTYNSRLGMQYIIISQRVRGKRNSKRDERERSIVPRDANWDRDMRARNAREARRFRFRAVTREYKPLSELPITRNDRFQNGEKNRGNRYECAGMYLGFIAPRWKPDGRYVGFNNTNIPFVRSIPFFNATMYRAHNASSKIKGGWRDKMFCFSLTHMRWELWKT